MELTDKQIEFMKRMELEVIPHKRNIDYDTLISVGSLVGIFINTACRSCAQKSGMDLMNLYGSLTPKYQEWCKKQIPVDIYTKYEEDITNGESIDYPEQIIGKIVEIQTEETLKDIVVADELPILNEFEEVGKTEEYHKLDVERTEEISKSIRKQIKKGKK